MLVEGEGENTEAMQTDQPAHSSSSLQSGQSRVRAPPPQHTIRQRFGLGHNRSVPPLKEDVPDEDRFAPDTDATARYRNLKGRMVVIDRGFAERDLEHPLIVDLIARNRWQNFAMH